MEWTVGAVATLRQMWADGHTASAIGEYLGCNKNAAIGKIHRLKLAPRIASKANPEFRWSGSAEAVLREMWGKLSSSRIASLIGTTRRSVSNKARRLKLLDDFENAPNRRRERPVQLQTGLDIRPRKQGRSDVTQTLPVQPKPSPVPAPVAVGTIGRCQWPLWSDKARSGGINARFCLEPTVPSRSWCPCHYAVVFTKRSIVEVADAA